MGGGHKVKNVIFRAQGELWRQAPPAQWPLMCSDPNNMWKRIKVHRSHRWSQRNTSKHQRPLNCLLRLCWWMDQHSKALLSRHTKASCITALRRKKCTESWNLTEFWPSRKESGKEKGHLWQCKCRKTNTKLNITEGNMEINSNLATPGKESRENVQWARMWPDPPPRDAAAAIWETPLHISRVEHAISLTDTSDKKTFELF